MECDDTQKASFARWKQLHFQEQAALASGDVTAQANSIRNLLAQLENAHSTRRYEYMCVM